MLINCVNIQTGLLTADISDLENMGLKITDYTKTADLNEAITRYYTLLKMSLESTNVYKIFETTTTQILRFAVSNIQGPQNNKVTNMILNVECTKCKTKHEIQARLSHDVKKYSTKKSYPKNDMFVCPNCKFLINLAPLRLQVESQSGKKIIL